MKQLRLKCFSVFLMFFMSISSLMAQTNKGIEAIYSGMYTTAKQIFIKQLTDSSSKPEACYYLGETYRLAGNKDSAAWYYELGSAGEKPNSLCLIGKAGLVMYGNPSLSADLIKKAEWIKEYDKKPELYVALAKVYADNKKFANAFDMLEIAKGIDSKQVYIYLTEGDILLQQNKPGDAAGKYETATFYDTVCKPAYLKLAHIYYKIRNYDLSSKYISKIILIDPHFSPALKLFGDISYEQGKYSDAVSAYAEFLQSPEAVLNDQVRYAYALFFNKEYRKSLDLISQLIPYFPNNQVLKRLQAYSSFEVGSYAEGLTRMQDFLNLVEPSAIIPSDYKYYARLLTKNDQDSLSIVYYQKALVTSASPQEIYKELAFVYEKMKKFSNAASYIEKFIKSAKTPASSDFFSWGRDCYFAAVSIDSIANVKDSILASLRNGLYNKADSIFGELVLLSPNNYLGYLWRGRVNAILDPETETGLAKPYYEKVAVLLDSTNSVNKKELIESYQYLGYYYYTKEDLQKSKIYWKNILAIDPTNEVARKAIEGIK